MLHLYRFLIYPSFYFSLFLLTFQSIASVNAEFRPCARVNDTTADCVTQYFCADYTSNGFCLENTAAIPLQFPDGDHFSTQSIHVVEEEDRCYKEYVCHWVAYSSTLGQCVMDPEPFPDWRKEKKKVEKPDCDVTSA